mmetsp:Transcript_9099/g.29913  ORF Transcript_9099/g.29913 Transcript_9099/m.29913 type:complete len:301 (+) Transcript_9099:1505-2407(+)
MACTAGPITTGASAAPARAESSASNSQMLTRVTTAVVAADESPTSAFPVASTAVAASGLPSPAPRGLRRNVVPSWRADVCTFVCRACPTSSVTKPRSCSGASRPLSASSRFCPAFLSAPLEPWERCKAHSASDPSGCCNSLAVSAASPSNETEEKGRPRSRLAAKLAHFEARALPPELAETSAASAHALSTTSPPCTSSVASPSAHAGSLPSSASHSSGASTDSARRTGRTRESPWRGSCAESTACSRARRRCAAAPASPCTKLSSNDPASSRSRAGARAARAALRARCAGASSSRRGAA